jgi:methionyl-tRNA synthetase
MLHAAKFKLPTRVHIHGFLTVGGEKMSKTRGTNVKAATYARHLDVSALRYYYASKLGPRLDDLDLNPGEFIDKVNSDLVGKVVNIASRCSRFVLTSGLSAKYPEDGGLFQQGITAGQEIADAYENCDYARAMRLIMELAASANVYIDGKEPWKLAKDPARAQEAQDACTVGLNLFRQIAVYLAPVLPKLAEQAGALLQEPITNWQQAHAPLVGTQVAPFSHMMKRLELKDFEAMVEESKEGQESGVKSQESGVASPADSDAALLAEPLVTDLISIDDFTKVDLRVARVINAEEVPEAKKLLKLTLGLGGDVKRQVFAGIKAAYKPEELVGRLVIVVANLQPRQMKFGLSEGMVTACGPGGEEVFLLSLDEGAKPGMRVH